jgi:predicted enzyme involved in methoxymalonyl-ACP biosynthesis
MICPLPHNLLFEEAESMAFNQTAETIKIALLADCEIQQFIPLLKALFRQGNFEAVIYVAILDGPELKDFRPESALFAFKPDLIVALNSLQSLRDQYYRHAGLPAEFLCEHRLRMARVWAYIQANSTALIIQANFADPIERIYERYALQLSSSLPRIVTRLNGFISLQIENSDRIRLLDIHQMASAAGLQQWFAEASPESAIAFCASEYLPLVAESILDIFMSFQEASLEGVNLGLEGLTWGEIIREDAMNTEPEDFFSSNYQTISIILSE